MRKETKLTKWTLIICFGLIAAYFATPARAIDTNSDDDMIRLSSMCSAINVYYAFLVHEDYPESRAAAINEGAYWAAVLTEWLDGDVEYGKSMVNWRVAEMSSNGEDEPTFDEVKPLAISCVDRREQLDAVAAYEGEST